MSVVDLLSTAAHAEKALHSAAGDLRGIAAKADSLQNGEHSARALRKLGVDLQGLGLVVEAKLVKDVAAAIERLSMSVCDLTRIAAVLDATSKQLKRRSEGALEAPSDETPPDGLYLERLSKALGSEYEWVTPALSRWLVSHMRQLRSMVRKLLGPAEITGDAELVAEAQSLLDEVNKGPSIEHGR